MDESDTDVGVTDPDVTIADPVKEAAADAACEDEQVVPCIEITAQPVSDNETVEELEEIFKGRYTDEDEKYVEAVAKAVALPPIVHPWYNKPQRNYDYNRRPREHHHHDGGNYSGRRHNWQQRERHHGGSSHHYREDNHNRYRQYSNNRHQPY